MPSAYATKSATPAAGDPARKLATTMARKGPMVQVSEATAYAVPKPIMEGAGGSAVPTLRDSPNP